MSLPTPTPEQRQAALAAAALARKARSEALAALKNGTITFHAVLADEDSPLQRARIRQVLRAIPGIGDVTADQIINEIRIDPKRRLNGLGARQRAALAARFS